jgi:Holliday junction DNA helicase RuvA
LGESVRLLVHPVVRETEWRLFGFLTVSERRVFRALLRVSGVGPVMALGLLSTLAPAEIRSAVEEGDAQTLTRVKGIGKKTAERIVVELRDVVAREIPREEGETPPGRASGVAEDAVRALVALGLDPREARRKVDRQREAAPDLTVGDLVRAALRS